jgi:hypothetical protein
LQGTVDPLPPALRPLAEQVRWVAWKWELSKQGKSTKVPKQAAHPQFNAKTNSPATWSKYATAIYAYKNRIQGVDGIGFMLHDSDVAALDLDKCRNVNTGEINDWAKRLVEKAGAFGAYVEVTPSGTGLRIIGTSRGEKVHRKISQRSDGSSSIELYRKCKRYITISGAELSACAELPNIDNLIDGILAEYENKPKDDPIPPDLMNLIRDGVEEGLRSAKFFRVVAELKRLGWTIDGITELLEQHANGIAAKYAGRIRSEVERVYGKIEGNDSKLAEMNERYCVVLDGGRTRVLTFEQYSRRIGRHQYVRNVPMFLGFDDFRNLHMNKLIPVGKKYIPLGQWWLGHQDRRQYAGITFQPGGADVVDNRLNLWRGWGSSRSRVTGR